MPIPRLPWFVGKNVVNQTNNGSMSAITPRPDTNRFRNKSSPPNVHFGGKLAAARIRQLFARSSAVTNASGDKASDNQHDISPSLLSLLKNFNAEEPDFAFRTSIRRAETTTFFGNSAARQDWIKELSEFINYSVAKIKGGQQPVSFTTHKDISLAGGIITMLNDRYPGLNLRRANSLDSFMHRLHELAQSGESHGHRERIMVRLAGLHHAIAEVQVGEGGRLNVTFIDAGHAQFDGVKDGIVALDKKLSELPGVETTYITSGAQDSLADCMIFSCCNAIEMYNSDICAWLRPSLAAHAETTAKNDFENITYFVENGASILPPEFYKYAHSARALRSMRQDERVKNVLDYHDANLVCRDGANYSAAIELARIELLDETRTHFSQGISDENLHRIVAASSID